MRDKRLFPVLFRGRASVPAFSPSDLPNLTLWLEAGVGTYQDAGATIPAVADTDLIALWQDQSGANHHAVTAADADRPALKLNIQNGKPSHRFSEPSVMSIASYPDSTYNKLISFFVVVNNVLAGSQGNILSYNSTSYAFTVAKSNAATSAGNASFAVAGAGNNLLNAWNGVGKNINSIVGSYDGTNQIVLVDGVKATKANSTNAGFATKSLYIGGFEGGNVGFRLYGDILEIGIYKSGLTEAQLLQLQSYCQNKYGFGTQLAKKIVFEGDSLTVGYPGTSGNSYPAQLMAQESSTYAYWNFAVTGGTIATMSAGARITKVNNVFLNSNVTNIMPIWIGTNDILGGVSAVDILSTLYAYLDARRVSGYKVIICTLLPNAGFSALQQAVRTAVNADILANWESHADGLCDIAADARFANSGDATYHTDNTHLTTAGNAVIAEIMKPVLDGLL